MPSRLRPDSVFLSITSFEAYILLTSRDGTGPQGKQPGQTQDRIFSLWNVTSPPRENLTVGAQQEREVQIQLSQVIYGSSLNTSTGSSTPA
jgi:hypothetical protein